MGSGKTEEGKGGRGKGREFKPLRKRRAKKAQGKEEDYPLKNKT